MKVTYEVIPNIDGNMVKKFTYENGMFLYHHMGDKGTEWEWQVTNHTLGGMLGPSGYGKTPSEARASWRTRAIMEIERMKVQIMTA